ncbi:MAG: CoA transferase [Dehalococcoidia bacterium]
MTLPLKGYRVLDATTWFQSIAARMMGDLGAEVIKIESRVIGDASRGMMQAQVATNGGSGRNWFFEHCNRNKKSITMDLGQGEK